MGTPGDTSVFFQYWHWCRWWYRLCFFKDTVELGAWDGQSEFSELDIDKMSPPR